MAGAGFQSFSAGSVLTASEVNTFLMQQSVMAFPDSTARGTAITLPSDGMVSYLQDSNTIEQYRASGSAIAAWEPISPGQGNKLINGDFGINQRGFSSTTANGTYGFDRWQLQKAGNGTTTYSAQTFTPGAAPVAGYEAENFARIVTTGQSTTAVRSELRQHIEDVRTCAGSTVTVSFWAMSAAGTPKIAVALQQKFGSGGSPSSNVDIYAGQVTISTSWQRYYVSVAVPSITGKTIGTTANTSALSLSFWVSAGSNFDALTGSLGIQTGTFDFWGVQVEQGTVVSPFSTATGFKQGELAACQRYYSKSYQADVAPGTVTNAGAIGWHQTVSTAGRNIAYVKFAQEMRISPPTSVTVYNPATGGTGSGRQQVTGNNVAVITNSPGSSGTNLVNNATSVGTDYMLAHYVAQAEF